MAITFGWPGSGPGWPGSGPAWAPGALGGSHRIDPFGGWRDPVPKPVVLAVNGIAYTLSIELALATDMVETTDDVRFRQLEIGRGILPLAAPPSARPRSLAGATRCASCSPPKSPAPPRHCGSGWSRRSCPPDRTSSRHGKPAQVIARQAPLGVQGALASARIGHSHGPDAAPEHLLALLPGILHSRDAAEGLRSFTERHEGRFTGH
jgi:enoyl-CoA hydratase/carnithine racemase